MPAQIRSATEGDRAWLRAHYIRAWGEEIVIGFGEDGPIHFDLSGLPALIAVSGGERVGALAWVPRRGAIEVASIAAETEGQGIGAALLRRLAEDCARDGFGMIRLTTTNDNLRALLFYQRCGFRITAIYPGGVDMARELKPGIPLEGANGLKMHDAIELKATPADILAALDG